MYKGPRSRLLHLKGIWDLLHSFFLSLVSNLSLLEWNEKTWTFRLLSWFVIVLYLKFLPSAVVQLVFYPKEGKVDLSLIFFLPPPSLHVLLVSCSLSLSFSRIDWWVEFTLRTLNNVAVQPNLSSHFIAPSFVCACVCVCVCVRACACVCVCVCVCVRERNVHLIQSLYKTYLDIEICRTLRFLALPLRVKYQQTFLWMGRIKIK